MMIQNYVRDQTSNCVDQNLEEGLAEKKCTRSILKKQRFITNCTVYTLNVHRVSLTVFTSKKRKNSIRIFSRNLNEMR